MCCEHVESLLIVSPVVDKKKEEAHRWRQY